MSSEDLMFSILSKPNGSGETASVGFVQDLHRFAKGNVEIIKSIKDPHKSIRAIMLKNQLIELLDEYDSIKRGAVNSTKRK